MLRKLIEEIAGVLVIISVLLVGESDAITVIVARILTILHCQSLVVMIILRRRIGELDMRE